MARAPRPGRARTAWCCSTGSCTPDIDPETLAVTAGFGLSSPAEGRLPRTWIALLAGRVRASLAASTGVEDAADVAAYLLAGADVVMTTSALLRHGPEHAHGAARRADRLDGPQRVHAAWTTSAASSPSLPARRGRPGAGRLRQVAARRRPRRRPLVIMVRPDDGDRAAGVVNAVGADRAEQSISKGAVATAAHHQQLRARRSLH